MIETKRMTYISLFSGIEAASVAWEPLGWEPLAFCEVDEFPSAVLAHRFPHVPNLGDITKVNWKEVIAEHGRPDVVVGGSPCQSFSVAGGRESLGGESRLMFEYLRACEEIHSTWVLWENVPGVLSTKDDAFGQLVDTLQDIGYVSLAWRVLDAQFFGVAQRRRRVFLVGRLGAGGGAAAVLFESESLRGNTQASREKREALAGDAARRPGGEGGQSLGFSWHVGATMGSLGEAVEQSPTLKARGETPAVMRAEGVTAFKYSAGAGARTMPAYTDGSCNTLTADWHSPAVAFAQNQRDEVRLVGGDGTVAAALSASTFGTHKQETLLVTSSTGEDVVGALCASDHKGAGQQYVADGKLLCMASGQGSTPIAEDGTAPTLTCLHEAPILAMTGEEHGEETDDAQAPPHRLV